MILNHIFERDLSRFCLLVTQKNYCQTAKNCDNSLSISSEDNRKNYL
ncbi:hypothetical protein BN1044_01749 [Hafnia alvei]|uniref:Uncharacterized protein n=1 Tax=Hafnia alvei TaxID=569 RepID=A0A1C6YZJ7_HAFAL|nr:hypothetical protein BN1044_01749 [Hafnia alvei]